MPEPTPISTSTYSFADLRRNGFLYVDKTKYFYQLVKRAKGRYFCARPRRFGKSLAISTFEAIFRGEKGLFNGLYIASADYAWETHPLIHLDFARMDVETLAGLKESLTKRLFDIAGAYDVTISGSTPTILFADLIEKLCQKESAGAIILIDEYDKPILEHLGEGTEAEHFRDFLQGFYQIIKGMDAYEHFVFITGVTKFAKVSIFSKLNNLTDITMDARFACMFGYTQAELEQNFDGWLTQTLAHSAAKMNRTELLGKLKDWYDGFRFVVDAEPVYNPVSVGSFFLSGGVFKNYWFSTGTPSFLVKLATQNQLTLEDIHGAVMSESALDLFDVAELSAQAAGRDKLFQLLFQTGYLTIDQLLWDTPERVYSLRFPNFEVRYSFAKNLFSAYQPQEQTSYVASIRRAAQSGDTESMMTWLKEIIANIPYHIQLPQEKYYQTMVCVILMMCGVDVRPEEMTNKGRIDAVLVTPQHIYIIEFKLNKSAEQAARQITDKDYGQKYRMTARAHGQTLHQLGINFSYDKDQRNITDWKETLL